MDSDAGATVQQQYTSTNHAASVSTAPEPTATPSAYTAPAPTVILEDNCTRSTNITTAATFPNATALKTKVFTARAP